MMEEAGRDISPPNAIDHSQPGTEGGVMDAGADVEVLAKQEAAKAAAAARAVRMIFLLLLGAMSCPVVTRTNKLTDALPVPRRRRSATSRTSSASLMRSWSRASLRRL